MLRKLVRGLGRIRVRLLVVNLVVLIVPVAGLEFARLYERQLLSAFEHDMRDQAVLARAAIESDLARGVPLSDPRHENILREAAVVSRMRIRLVDASGVVVVDSHAHGAPEGPEPPAPSYLIPPVASLAVHAGRAVAGGIQKVERSLRTRSTGRDWSSYTETWPELLARMEIRQALAGRPSAITRRALSPPSLFLCLTEPVRAQGNVVGVVYVVQSTRPVLVELYRIRSGLFWILLAALAGTLIITLVLAWTISRPLGKLSRAAQRIANGERNVPVPSLGGGEIGELADSFKQMTDQLDARMRYIEGFAADVAHEFKSPLTSIRGAAELLEEGAADDPDARKRFLANIGQDVARLDRLVTRLLELSRIEASGTLPMTFDVTTVLGRVRRRFDSPEHPVALACTLASPWVLARETDLETALVNLLDNAARFSPPGATIELAAKDAPEHVLFSVADHGAGVPDEHRTAIFERFFTTDVSRRGTGLGLAIVASVAHAHGGFVKVLPTPGGGATFVMAIARRSERRL